MSPLFIVVFLLAGVGSSALIFLAVRAGARRQEKYRELAKRNGWRHEFHPASGGGPSETVFSNPSEGWMLTLHQSSSSTAGGSGGTTSWSEFRDTSLAIPEGMAVLGPDIPDKTKAMADKMMGMMGGDLGRFFLNKITGGLGEEAQGLRSVDSEGPGHLMASPGAETALDNLRFAPELANARAGRNEAQQPIVMRGPFGLRVRLAHRLRKPDQIQDFIRLGRALADNLRTG